jgi:hypothetical protein
VTDPESAEIMIDTFLQLCEDRQLDEASTYLAADVDIIFPGDRRYAGLHDMAAASKGRYAWVRKNRIRYFVAEHTNANGDREQVVTSIGTLFGENNDGTAFADVRYVDIFTIRNDLIVRQEVWNDLAENGIIHVTSEGK